ncbi:unnamed protein product [Haemonchus placei]|uniref:Uncharacterized protein n=1 Tax=Haemonchus placei TaxID=6290 RepID=A0A0N4WL99_HAEPC|nr:unnamed protein product [Haemonchus placei]
MNRYVLWEGQETAVPDSIERQELLQVRMNEGNILLGNRATRSFSSLPYVDISRPQIEALELFRLVVDVSVREYSRLNRRKPDVPEKTLSKKSIIKSAFQKSSAISIIGLRLRKFFG